MNAILQTVLTTSFHGSIVILAVLLLRLVLRKAPKKFICLLWMLAGVRLLLPIPIESAYSLQPQSFSVTIPANFANLLPVIWIVLAIGIGVYSIWSYIHLRRQVLDAVKIPGGWESDRIETAFVLGFIKPKIYIPTGMSGETRRQILAHERTHLDKGDHWIKMIGFLALAVHWFNPLVWVSYILLCKDMEMACDERVVQFMELEERKAYSAALLRCSTNRAHYAACPVAFGEISVKYRIKSILNYRKPGFWISLLAVVAFVFVAVCFMTNPRTVVEIPVDADVPLREMSQEDPAQFTPAVLPEVEPNPDWGVDVIMDATSPTGGILVYVVEERFAAASERMSMKDSFLEKWNGTAWEPLPSRSENTPLLEIQSIGFAKSRDLAVNYHEEEVDWKLIYGALPAGDYRLCQTIESVSDSAVFRAPFHIYREELPSDEEAALERCDSALTTLVNETGYSILFSGTAPDGEVYPVQRITKSGSSARIDHYLGEYCVSSSNDEAAFYSTTNWDADFRVNQNRQFLFPEGQSVISQEEITFCSVWADYKGNAYQGKDTFRFHEDGTLKSVERLIQSVNSLGEVVAEKEQRLETIPADRDLGYSEYIRSVGTYEVEDSFDTQNQSPWGIFFRVDDDLLAPGAGEIWLATNAVGVSNYTTDGSYWLEKKVGSSWERLGGENTQASWGEETIKLVSQTAIRQVDWSEVYGNLDAGVYRMGKRFYNGAESIIQYAEFAIYQTGGVFGEGGEEALARVDAAIEKLQSGNYRVEELNSSYSSYGDSYHMATVIWKYGDTMVTDYYNDVEKYSHSSVADGPDDFGYGDWLKRTYYPSEYDSIYFPAGYGLISEREIRLAYSYSMDSAANPCTLYTYRFDEQGNLTELMRESCGGMWDGYVTHYFVTDTPESEIQAWVAAKKAEQ